MNPTPELIAFIQQDIERAAERSRLARLAACARACQSASVGLFERLTRLLLVGRTADQCGC